MKNNVIYSRRLLYQAASRYLEIHSKVGRAEALLWAKQFVRGDVVYHRKLVAAINELSGTPSKEN